MVYIYSLYTTTVINFTIPVLLHLHVKRTITLSDYRIRLASNFKAGDLTGHLAILTDLRAVTLNLEQSFRVLIPSREKCGLRRPKIEKGSL